MARGGGGIRVKKASSSHSPWTLLLTLLLTLSILFLILLAFRIVALPSLKSSPDDISLRLPAASVVKNAEKEDREELDAAISWVEVISWEPRASIYHNFLSKEECEYLIDMAKPRMEKSTVVDSASGKSKDSRVRTSSGTFFRRGQDKVIRRIEKRVADFTFIPIEHGEGLQVLHYEVGQRYEPHYDYFHDDFNVKSGGQRMATVLMYLSDVESGGETVFPATKANSSFVRWWDELSECGKSGLSVRPKQGDALLFWSMKPDATLDPSSLHGGCPVILGNKWSATKWIRVHEYK